MTSRPSVSAANVQPGAAFGEIGTCKATFCGPQFVGGKPDLSHVILESNVALTEGATTPGFYEWSANHLTLDWQAGCTRELVALEFRAISTDGSLVVSKVNWKVTRGCSYTTRPPEKRRL